MSLKEHWRHEEFESFFGAGATKVISESFKSSKEALWGIVMFISGSSNCIIFSNDFFLKLSHIFGGKEMKEFTPQGKDTDLLWKTENPESGCLKLMKKDFRTNITERGE